MSQARLAETIGVDRTAVNHWVTDRNEPRGENLRRLIEALHCSTDYLYGLTDDPTPPWVTRIEAEVLKRAPGRPGPTFPLQQRPRRDNV